MQLLAGTASPSAVSSQNIYQQLLAVPQFVGAFDSIELAFLQIALQDNGKQRPTVQQLLADDPYLQHGPVCKECSSTTRHMHAASRADDQPPVCGGDAVRDSKDSLTWAAVSEMLRDYGY
jgi:hypothetical protein